MKLLSLPLVLCFHYNFFNLHSIAVFHLLVHKKCITYISTVQIRKKNQKLRKQSNQVLTFFLQILNNTSEMNLVTLVVNWIEITEIWIRNVWKYTKLLTSSSCIMHHNHKSSHFTNTYQVLVYLIKNRINYVFSKNVFFFSQKKHIMVLHVFLFDKIKINSIQSYFFLLKSLVPFDNYIYFLTKAKSL